MILSDPERLYRVIQIVKEIEEETTDLDTRVVELRDRLGNHPGSMHDLYTGLILLGMHMTPAQKLRFIKPAVGMRSGRRSP